MFTRMLKALWLVVLLSGSVAMAETKPAAQETAPAVAATTEDGAPTGVSTAPYNDPALPPEVVVRAPGVPEIDAKSYLLVDFQSGEELA